MDSNHHSPKAPRLQRGELAHARRPPVKMQSGADTTQHVVKTKEGDPPGSPSSGLVVRLGDLARVPPDEGSGMTAIPARGAGFEGRAGCVLHRRHDGWRSAAGRSVRHMVCRWKAS